MAAEVPVSDVLCEAMEYLSKLGSNLRTRSENLKEKRITKEKLKNAHAVQKAADKVLLICELSKKSLDNVETGVRKVLSMLKESQADSTDGGKTNHIKNCENKQSSHFIEYKSRKLRIAKKISLKHYMSVKVLARGMPASMRDKYPVYYDCKLKRKRDKLQDKKLPEGKKKKTVSFAGLSPERDLSDDGDKGHDNDKVENNENSDKETAENDLQNNDSDSDNNSSKHKSHRSQHASENSECDDAPKDISEVNENQEQSESDDNAFVKEKCVTQRSSKKENDNDSDEHKELSIKSNHRNKTNGSNKRERNKKRSRKRSFNISSDSDNESQTPKKINLCSDEEEAENKDDSDVIKHQPKKMKLETNEDSNIPLDSHCKEAEVDQPEKDNNSDKNNSDNESTGTKMSDDNQSNSSETPKPLIRCVNLSKLLKPDAINDIKSSNNTSDKGQSSKKNKLSLNKSSQHVNKEAKDQGNTSKKDDETYWAQKRKEVREFKSKKFSINIERLPRLSVNYLLALKLKKITRKGAVICEVENEKIEKNAKKIDAVKSLLLNDSDSDDPGGASESNKVKKSLLNDSDSEHKSSDSKQRKNCDNAQAGGQDKSDSESLSERLHYNSDSENKRTGKKGKRVGKGNESTEDQYSRTVTPNEEATEEGIHEPNDSSNTQQDVNTSEIPSKQNKRVTSSLLNNTSDENSSEKNSKSLTKSNDKVKSALLNDSSDERSEKEDAEAPTKNNDKAQSAMNDSSDEKSAKKDPKNPTKTNDKEKSALLNDSSDERSAKEDAETPSKSIDKVKSALLNDSSDEKSSKDDAETPTKSNEKIKSALLNDSSDEKSHKEDADTPSKSNDKVKSALLKDSSDEKSDKEKTSNNSSDDKTCDNDEETPTKTNEKVKSALLNDSSEEKSDKNDQESLTKANEKVKSSLLKDSSNDRSDSSDDDTKRVKKKTPKSKRKHARKCREAKKNLRYSESSDSEQESSKKDNKKHSRRKSHVSSSSSSSEDIMKKIKNKKSKDNNADKNSSDDDKDSNKDINQCDGNFDEQSSENSSSKMVRSKAKPSGSSSLNSDTQDASDKDIDRLTNLNSLNKDRRRDLSTKSREDTDKQKNSQSKVIGEDLLKAESSDDASDNDGEDLEQDLPSVTLPGLNGDSVDHMAKNDLLVESDSSVSHKDQTENADNTNETDEEENLKSKRRKANAISSDSEGGSHRRKQPEDERMSDFEDSEDENSEPTKKSKRKKKQSDSDASVDSNDGGKKKRRRIKPLNDSDASGSDTENEGRNKHGRKNIRKVMGKNQLEEATKKAAREEKERIARITERQKLYNNLDFDESGKPDEVVLEKVVLDFDPETKEPLIQVDRGLVKKLKPHQANGIKFMWDACFESVKRIKKDKGSGCILAHCMGLGKTLQVISLTHTLLTYGNLTGVNRVLVVCPLSTVLNWVNEFRMWLKHAEAEFEVDVYELSRYKQNSERAFQLQQWIDGGGVCVLGYEMFRNLSADNNKKFKKKMLRSFQESLVDPGPDLVVCDEGHLLKNEKTSLSQSMNRVKTRRRIVLTGTPLQNNLKEYYCMVQFVKPNLLGKYNEYLNRFVNPITNGQYTDSTEHDIRVMKRRSHVLHKMLDGAVQRRDYGVLAPFLPPKHEYVLFITLTDVQVKLYQFYLDNYSRRPLPGKSSGFLFPDFQSLQRIWTHPLVLKYNSERYEIMQQKKRDKEEEDSEGSLVDFIDDDSTPEETSTEESTDELSDMSDDSRKKSKKKKSAKKGKSKDTKVSTRRGTRANPVEAEEEDPDNDDVVEVKNENPTEWWIKLVEEAELDDMRNSHKLVLLFDILRQCETIGDKLLVFSQSLYSLDLIEHFLGKVDEATQEGRIDEKLGGHVGSWSPGVDYFRLDGSTSCENRSIWCKNFNREDNPRARLFLISTRAGGLGINLVAANRVVIFDVSWNPSHDVQSIFRVYRFGQKKPCYIYRFLAMGTMEEKIYERQVTKQAISKRVIDEQQIDRHYAENDLAELYKFEARPDEPRPLPTLPKDRLFAEMLKEHEAQIYKYHEHDSLLENKEEETLSEEERKAAWEDFENEKNKPPPAPFPSAWPMHNGMVPGLLAQQQQQLAYAALAAMLRKDMPNINDNQIRDMLPLIYNSNPGMFGGYDYSLMQKMSDIYKYAQPGMMNPSMMNPVMNPGSGGGGMGGTSGLQYEPPWQRQHQQQQQMRLQQLMQQNQMGAKFYAGGLGSRDPVAMALQQQRAREIMMGGATTGRPRGRPPIHPRVPSTNPQDVVNLDSD
ncbi:ATRX chromatin remodeler XNP isoform X3 [Anticarsia gemmatalis]|uniref:ATRX chromatin remodeler XNP isoform X3 n=1 Tax=Anticarsia gemmatalis TaxID=129554 RepID=UPI003F75E1D2